MLLNSLSPQQQAAARAFLAGLNVASISGAGAGKTKTLTTLIAELLSPANPNKALVEQVFAFTYTEKAAREMKERLRKEVSRLARTGAAQERAYWRAVRDRLPLLSIGTFHSFCQRLLTQYPVEAGVNPAFEVADEATADLMIDEVTIELLQALSDTNAEDLAALSVHFELYALAELIPSILKVLRQRGVTVGQAVTETELPAAVASAAMDALREAVDTWLADGDQKSEAYKDQRVRLLQRWDLLKDKLSPGAIDVGLLDDLGRLVAIPDKRSPRRKPMVEAMEQAVGQITACYASKLAITLLRLVQQVWAEYEVRKQVQSLLDFDDLVWKARLVLMNPQVRTQISGSISHILVDEFQDTDQLQWAVIRLLLGQVPDSDDPLPAGKLFIVGDGKQSVYRFRGAQVEVFEQVVERLRRDGGELKPLQVNYRSRPAVIRFANALFRPLQVVKNDEDEMQEHREQGFDPVSVELLLCESGEQKASRAEEAELIAARIQQLVHAGMTVETDGRERHIQYGDFAILFRAMSQVEHYARALAKAGIPYYVVSGRGFYSQEEVQDLINLLQAVVNPTDSASLFGALRGPAFSLRDDTLFLLMDRAGGDLAAGLSRAAEVLPTGEERDRVIRAGKLLADLRSAILREPVDRALDLVLRETGMLEVLITRPDGEQRIANIQKIAGWVRQGPRGGLRDLASLTRWLEMNRDREVREGLAATAAQQDPTTVKLLTVHKAKGLEWPVVVVADTSYRRQSRSDGARYRPGKGLAVRLKGALGEDLPNGLWEELKKQNEAEETQEEARLFYVACTRARDLLILSGRPSAATKGTWLSHLRFLFDDSVGADAGWAGGPVRICRREDVVAPDKVEDPFVLAEVAATAEVQRSIDEARVRERMAPVALNYGQGLAPASSSRLMDLTACPRRYYLRYVLGMPEPKAMATTAPVVGDEETEHTEWVDPTDRGQVLHWICERLRAPEQIPQLIEQALQVYRLAGSPQGDALAVTAQEMLERYVASPFFSRMQQGQVHAEVPFTLEVGGLRLEGRIDALGKDSAGKAMLVDYKTNRVSELDVPTQAKSYELQMGVYALAARNLGYEVTEATLLFLEPGVAYSVPVDFAAVEATINRLAEQIRKGSTEIGDYPQDVSHCYKCRFRLICGT